MKKLLPFVATAIISVLVTATSIALYPTNSKEATAAVAFDHSNCQYPDRWSNPVDGCDNSDPAVPECIKSAFTQESEKACIDAFVAKYNEQNPTPVTTTPPVVSTPAPVVNTCK